MSSLNGRGRTVQLADGPHEVRFDCNRLIDVEEACGSFSGFFEAAASKPVWATRYLLWATGAGDSLEAAGERMSGIPINPLTKALISALTEDMGSSDNAGEAGEEGRVDPTIPTPPTPGGVSSPSAS